MATMNVSLPDQLKQWVEAQTRDGLYSNTSDYVRDLIRKDQLRQNAIQIMQTAITDGLESGSAEVMDMEAFHLKMLDKHVVKND